MTEKMITFSGDKVALIVRGKTSEDHSPGKMEQHADCARSDGSPVGYFGGDGAGSSESSGSSGGSGRGSAMSAFASSAILVGIEGQVYDLQEFQIKRPYYIDSGRAKTAGVVSTVLIVTVANGEATKFDEYWGSLKEDPGTFRLLGKNCSTRASGAFRHAGILSGGIPGLDTPNNLFKQLKAERPDRCTSYSGYVGFQVAGNGFSLRIAAL